MEKDSVTKKIWGYLGELGWPHELVSEAVVSAAYQGQFGSVKVMLQTAQNGVRMAINPVLQRPLGGWGKSVARLVKILNEEAHLIRVGLDNDGDVYVKVDLPAEGLDFEQFSYVLFNLCQVAEQLMVPVLQAQAYDRLDNDPTLKP